MGKLESQRLFFVLGRGRSGTTLLRNILNVNDKIHVAPETMYILFVLNKFRNVKNWNTKKIESFIKCISSERRFQDNLNVDLDECKKMMLDTLPDTNFKELCKIPYSLNANNENTIQLGDKNPLYSLYADSLMKAFPSSKFIFIHRNPKSNVYSYQNVKFDFNSHKLLAHRWNLYNSSILNAIGQNNIDLLNLKYEDLILNPRETIIKVCDFLEIEFQEKMLEFHKYSNQDQDWHKNISNTFDPTILKNWERNLTEKQIVDIDRITNKISYKLSYQSKRYNRSQYFSLSFYLSLISIQLEKLIILFPNNLRNIFINFYRKKTGSI